MPVEPTVSAPHLTAARHLARELAGIGPAERVVLVHDESSDPETLATIDSALREIGCARVAQTVTEFGQANNDVDVVVSLAAPLLTHTDELRARLRRGARYLNLRGLDLDALRSALDVDFAAMNVLTERLAGVMHVGARVSLSDDAGSALTFTVDHALALSGIARNPGQIGGYPGGEAAAVPVPGSVQGEIRAPIFVEGIRTKSPALTLEIRDGQVITMSPTPAAADLERRVGDDPAGLRVGEFGLGTHPTLELITARHAKKRLGTAHIGLGDNQTFGGDIRSRAHIDVIVEMPTVVIDDVPILDHGTLVWS